MDFVDSYAIAYTDLIWKSKNSFIGKKMKPKGSENRPAIKEKC
jgi:hypothetical protein